jgi:hypothetical protein
MEEDTDNFNEKEEVFPFKGYLKLNAIMWAFCLIVIMIAYTFTDAGEVIRFLFGFLAIGFSVVSIYDWLFDKFIKDI